MKNEVLNGIFNHRSVRKFNPDFVIPEKDIRLIIEAGQRAATSCTGQMYSIIEIPKSERETAFKFCGEQDFTVEASFFGVICVDIHRLQKIVKLSGGTNPDWKIASLMIGIYDAGLFGQNMALAAQSLGYDICFCGSCGDKPDEFSEVLKLPEMVLPLTGIAIGKGIEDPPRRPRIPIDLVYHKSHYKEYTDAELNDAIDKMGKELTEEGYYQKYSSQSLDFTWRDHMKGKFGGRWLNIIEKRRIKALKKQGFFDK